MITPSDIHIVVDFRKCQFQKAHMYQVSQKCHSRLLKWLFIYCANLMPGSQHVFLMKIKKKIGRQIRLSKSSRQLGFESSNANDTTKKIKLTSNTLQVDNISSF